MDTLQFLEKFVLPVITLVVGWLAKGWRTRQKKEQDILSNVQQILSSQKDYIADQDERNTKSNNMIARLEKKLDDKNRSIRRANGCKYTNMDGGCPVLNSEEDNDKSPCDNCTYKKQEEENNDNGEN